ncbi:hypothetical protein [Deinococcus petrolearius]|uniref:Uncharacterized protein n=1 Tax=Deinococcus petrolearius TaxID=1751295 RepID=A0ABW1DFV5_9DEIO
MGLVQTPIESFTQCFNPSGIRLILLAVFLPIPTVTFFAARRQDRLDRVMADLDRAPADAGYVGPHLPGPFWPGAPREPKDSLWAPRKRACPPGRMQGVWTSSPDCSPRWASRGRRA